MHSKQQTHANRVKLGLAALSALFAWVCCGATYSHAQVTAAPDPVQYIVAPDTPGPNAPVTITVQGVGSFLGDADITWKLNGVVAKQGVGASSFSFTTGGLGAQGIVSLTIDSATEGTITHTFAFNPSTVDLVWEADTSAPPLYAGHTLYSAGSPLKVVAFPTVIEAGKKVAAQSLSYQWTINDTPQPASSGTGRYALSFTGDQLQTDEDVEVDVYFGSAKVGHAEIDIPASTPMLLLYNKDPLRGVVWDEALPASIALNTNEITLQAQPYFFANSAVNNGSLSWSWALGGNPISGPDSSQGILTLRQTGTGQGSAQLSVSAQNESDTQLIQSAQAALDILFGQAQSGVASFFGL